MKLNQLIISGFIAITSCSTLLAKSPQSSRKIAFSPEKQQTTFQLQDGFMIELVASEENGLINPIDLTFDDAGRLWTQTAEMYPLDPVPGISFGKAMTMMKDHSLVTKDKRFGKIHDYYTLKKKGTDKILIIDNPQEKAEGDLEVWADGLTIPQSIMPYKDGCYVAHGSEMFFLDDKDKDGKQDSVETVLSGFGFFDTHTMAHSIVRGPGNWMYFSHGAVNSGNVKVMKSGKEVNVTYSKNARFSIDGESLEIINCHRDNNWGYQVKSNGQWYSTSANDGGYSVLPFESMSSIPGNGNDLIRPYSPFFPSAHSFRVGGTGISGLAFSEDGAKGFPAHFKNVAILANPMTRSLNCVSVIRNPDGTITSKRLPDLLKCTDEWFRPVNIEFGPDGCLYVADWYNQIISHNEVTTDHPDRDRAHGRIWRIRHESQKPFDIPNLAAADTSELIQHLTAGKTLWEKRAAWHQIVDRKAGELIPQLKKILADDKATNEARVLALWSIEGLKHYDKALLKTVIDGSDKDLRREAIRSLASFKTSAEDTVELISPYLEDDHYMIRSQILRTLDEINEANEQTIALLIKASKPAATTNELGGDYERNFERFLARKALEKYPSELKAFLATDAASKFPAGNVLWALQALSEEDRINLFVANWKKASQGEIDKNTLTSVSKMLHIPAIKKVVEPTFKSRSDELLQLTLENFDTVATSNISVFYQEKIEALLNSEDENQIKEGVTLVNKLRSPYHAVTLSKLISPTLPASLQKQIFSGLSYNNTLKSNIYQTIFNNTEYSDDMRISSLAACALKNPKFATDAAKEYTLSLEKAQKAQLVHTLSYTAQGNTILKYLYKEKALSADDWDYNSAYRLRDNNLSAKVQGQVLLGKELRAYERQLASLRKDKTANAIFNDAQKTEDVAIDQRHDRVKTYIEASKKIKGNPELGKAYFISCQVCHKVGSEGQDLAPALDGGKDRNIEHLITAIVNPDDAVEGTYGLYSVVRSDGSFIEGQLVKSSPDGTLIGLPGGNNVFIDASNISYQGNVNSRSFMPNTFGNFDEQTMIDLITYIKSIP